MRSVSSNPSYQLVIVDSLALYNWLAISSSSKVANQPFEFGLNTEVGGMSLNDQCRLRLYFQCVFVANGAEIQCDDGHLCPYQHHIPCRTNSRKPDNTIKPPFLPAGRSDTEV